jgi:hypothetical protein
MSILAQFQQYAQNMVTCKFSVFFGVGVQQENHY